MSNAHRVAAAAHPESEPVYAGEIEPAEAWELLNKNPHAVLIDVRTQPEWMFSGVANLAELGKKLELVSWKTYPHYQYNERFVEQVEAIAPALDTPLIFICKTGGRSLDAACAMTAHGYTACYNLTGGFEGDFNEQRQRGEVNGWKAAGLPWEQA